jgi:NADPH2:quinone reductase
MEVPMVQTVRFQEPGGPDVLRLEDVELPPPGPGEAQVRHQAIGVSFVDIYQRSGLYRMPTMPSGLGVEGAGVVDAVGPDVNGLVPGQPVVYAGLPVGGYAAARNLPAWRLVPLPAGLDPAATAALFLRGITAFMLLDRVRAVRPGDVLLVHAAAGGLGLVLTQWAKRRGARVIGTVGSAAKAETALAHGLDHAILYRDQDLASEARRLTDGRGVDYAIDGVGGETLIKTLDVVRPFGMVASIGQAAGPVRPIDIAEIGPARSLAFARPSVLRLTGDPEAYREAARVVLDMAGEGLAAAIGGIWPLAAAAEAHRALGAGRTTGSLLLVPD